MNADKMRLYFDDTGHVFFNLSVIGDYPVEKDIERFIILSERNRDSFDFLEWPLDQFILEMSESTGYRVNTKTKELEFTQSDSGKPDEPQVFGPPLTEQIKELKEENLAIKVENGIINSDIISIWETILG